jgi:hypothetical protein
MFYIVIFVLFDIQKHIIIVRARTKGRAGIREIASILNRFQFRARVIKAYLSVLIERLNGM